MAGLAGPCTSRVVLCGMLRCCGASLPQTFIGNTEHRNLFLVGGVIGRPDLGTREYLVMSTSVYHLHPLLVWIPAKVVRLLLANPPRSPNCEGGTWRVGASWAEATWLSNMGRLPALSYLVQTR